MKSRYSFIVVMALLICTSVQAQDVPPPSPPAPEVPSVSRGPRIPMVHSLPIGPISSTTVARTARGKVAPTANPPREITPATVELFVDQTSLGTAAQKPYMKEFDSTTIPDGEHMFKAVARNAGGAEIWSASLKVNVRNTELFGSPNSVPRVPTGPTPASAPPPGLGPAGAPGIPPLDQFYTSPRYGLSIRYPAGWIVQDQTSSMKPKAPGGFWFVFGTQPIAKSPMVVNIRGRKLELTTDADTFARYNKYVLKWERKTVLDATAFATISGSPATKRVTHRLIIIKDGSAWMFNCIDTSGGPADNSLKLFQGMVDSLQITPG